MNPQPAALEVKDLTVGYKRESIVAGIDIQLEPGKMLALVGVNGSGKSTLLKTIAGLLPALDGSIKVLGAVPGASPRRVAYLSQFHPAGFMLPLRSIDVVRMGRYPHVGLFRRLTATDEQAVQEAMDLMDVGPIADTALHLLSGGQRQRVFLAQLFARGADLLLVDEPAAGLDAASQETYRRAFQSLCQRGTSVVLATHDIKEASRCDQAMLLARRVVAYGNGAAVLTPEALLSTFGIIARFEGGQVIVVEREHGHDHKGATDHHE